MLRFGAGRQNLQLRSSQHALTGQGAQEQGPVGAIPTRVQGNKQVGSLLHNAVRARIWTQAAATPDVPPPDDQATQALATRTTARTETESRAEARVKRRARELGEHGPMAAHALLGCAGLPQRHQTHLGVTGGLLGGALDGAGLGASASLGAGLGLAALRGAGSHVAHGGGAQQHGHVGVEGGGTLQEVLA